jgi:hypothetical protein
MVLFGHAHSQASLLHGAHVGVGGILRLPDLVRWRLRGG